jgi:hypothetical protein
VFGVLIAMRKVCLRVSKGVVQRDEIREEKRGPVSNSGWVFRYQGV